MKYTYMIFLLLMSPVSLNAMRPDVTRWQEICKNLEEKQKLMTIYKDFCQKRVKENILWVTGTGCCAIISAAIIVRVEPVIGSVLLGYWGLFGMSQIYFLKRNVYRSNLAQQEDLSYLNHDVLEELGNPMVSEGSSHFRTAAYVNSNTYTKHTFGGYSLDKERTEEDLSVDNVDGIKKALSGRYWSVPCTIHP